MNASDGSRQQVVVFIGDGCFEANAAVEVASFDWDDFKESPKEYWEGVDESVRALFTSSQREEVEAELRDEDDDALSAAMDEEESSEEEQEASDGKR